MINHSRGTILVVEENSAVRRVAQRGLVRMGYHVLVAGDRDCALSLLGMNQDWIQVVVSNIPLPRINHTTRYLFTGARMWDPERAPSTPGTAFLIKPWTLAELAGAIDALLLDT